MLDAVKSLAPGFLIAMPQLGDPNFHRAVVLMIEHGETGSMGLVLNRQGPLSLKDLARGQKMRLSPERHRDSVYIGGPVEPQRGFLLHDAPGIAEKHEVMPGLYLSLTLDALQPLLERDEGHLRFCLGYAGWGPKQLEGELAGGSWLFCEAAPAAVLVGDPANLWERTLRDMGVDPMTLVPARGLN
jgi:putative transcriptional regulator